MFKMNMMVDVEGQAPCLLACGGPIESIAHLMFKCRVTATSRAHMYDVIKTSELDSP
jgi:hypothetical protein